ncbi:hypothetical protein MUN82_03505 [Hymenobacter aerilatus]|uniref:DUF3828 domain-containing protein n=1 Tax=Hymenobacter aerilatus TaxID=2932251 RepID=A0A8T9T2E9_9BACT|nr:hypothetical protein [Hymenobacter aerilatus]UOR06169.1 hypothetical protein MUN82_03505 [Hymenobacter aerilatus]
MLVSCACTHSASEETTASGAERPVPAHTTTDTAATPVAVVQQFLRWYAPQADELNQLPLVPAAYSEDSTDIYAVDLEAVDSYLTTLRSSGYVSAAYAAARRAEYQQWADTLRLHPQYDGPPAGFDYDPIIFSQDAEELTELLRATPHLQHHTTDSAQVVLPQPSHAQMPRTGLAFGLSRHTGHWQIDKIWPVFTD